MHRRTARNILNHMEHVAGYFCKGKTTVLITLIFGMGFIFCLTSVPAQDPAGKDLRKFYQDNCARCHGPDGSAVNAEGKKLKGENFTDQDWQDSTTDKKMVKTIMKGIFFGLAMPRFKDSLTEEEAQRMVTDIIRKSKKGQVIFTDIEDTAPGSQK